MQITNIPDPGFDDLTLRNIRVGDVAAWYAYLKNPDAIRHTSWNLESAGDLLPQLAIYETDAVNSPIRLAIVRKADDVLIGTVGFHTMSDLNRSAELAYDLAPEYWGRRIMPAAARALCEWGFGEGRLNRIQATVLEGNVSSVRVLERLGFQCEGYLRAFRMVRGKPGNFWMYALLHPHITG
ncbi:GNAT family N-acetyltransferase [Undibacterium sp. Ji50W]|uniref:GNAT family N-acetyltransferase n=1 Tax=Undibacterium sp. Ji50W TaxID=3413041 RepID=UPI003BF0A4A4